MGGRQSSQQNSHRQVVAHQQSSNPVLFTSSLENVTDRSPTSIVSGGSGSLNLAYTPLRGANRRRRRTRDEPHSFPSHLFPTFLSAEIKCPVCNKRIGSDEIESHLLSCLSKPRVSYNEDILKADAGECIICFDDMVEGEHIARLPCLCIYHKKCLDDWFQRNRCCPEHPDQIPNQDYPSTSNEAGESSSSSSAEPSVLLASTSAPTATSRISSYSRQNTSSNDDENYDNVVANSPISNVTGATANNDESSTTSRNNQIKPERPIRPERRRSSQNYQAVLVSSEISSNATTVVQPRDSTTSPVVQPLDIEEGEETNETVNLESNLMSPSSQLSVINEVLSQNSSFSDIDISQNEEVELSPRHRTIVHVDDGSIHGSPSLFNDDDLAQLASKIKTILVAESPRRSDQQDNT